MIRREISDLQAEWLENTALATDRRIIVLSHCPIHNAGIFGTASYPDGMVGYDDLFNSPRVYQAIRKCDKVIAMIAGHVHYDNLIYDDKVLSITSLCSMAQKWAPSCPDRNIGTVTETAFDVFSVTDQVIYMTRFGAGNDRVACILRP